MKKEKQIEEIIEWFDWEDVHKAMVALDWKWGIEAEVPSIGRLVNKARDMLDRVWESREKAGSREYILSTGGFKAECVEFEDGSVRLGLAFELSTWDTFDYLD